MKKCPSCNVDCDDTVEVCPSCGYQFDDVVEDSKRTMMGFPSLSDGVEDAEELEAPDPVKQTLFGFPAQKGEDDGDRDGGEDAAVEESEPEDSGEYAATAVLSPDQFEFPEKNDEEEDLRGTVAGMALEDRASEDDDATQIVSGTAVFPGNQAGADADDGGEGLRAKGTLMGMSLQEAAKEEAADADDGETEQDLGRATQFAIPAAQRSEGAKDTHPDSPLHLDEESEESEEPIDDAPTQAWSPGAFGATSKSDPDQGRKKLLEKIRKSRPTNRETSKGLPSPSSTRTKSGVGAESPDLSALRKLRPKRELKATPAGIDESERETDEQASPPALPGSPAAERRSELRKGAPPAGASSYLLGRDSSKPKGVAIGSILRKKEETAIEPEELEQPTESDGLGDALSDPSFGLAETGVASGDLLRQAGVGDESPDRRDDLSGPAFEESHYGSSQGPGRSPTTQQGVGSPIDPAPLQAPAPAKQQQATPKAADDQPDPRPQQRTPAHTPNPNAPRQFEGPSAHGSQRASPGVYETFDGAQSSPGPSRLQTEGTANPAKKTSQPVPDAMDDPLVRQIQTLFGILAGAIVLIVQGVVVMVDGTPAITGSLVVAFACMLGVAAIVAAAFPVASKIRSLLLLAVAAFLVVSIIIGIAVALPNTFLVVGLAALVAMMAAAFPYVARYLL